MTYDKEATVRNAYHMAAGNVLDIPGWIGSFSEDGVFNNHADEPGVIYAANNHGLFRSDNAGRGWKALDILGQGPGPADGVQALAPGLPE